MNWAEMYLSKIAKAGSLNEYLQKKEGRSGGSLIRHIRQKFKPGSRILEVGTGTGAIGALLTKYGFDVVSIDNNQEMIDIAKKFFGIFNRSDNVVLVDAKDVIDKFGENSFDCVVSHGMLEHYSDNEILKFLRFQLAVAPIVIFVVPTGSMSADYRARGFGDERYLPTRYWVKLIKQDFAIKDIFGFGFKETNLPSCLEILFKNYTMTKLLAPLCGINEFWIARRI